MKRTRRRLVSLLMGVAAACALGAGVGRAFTANNTVPASRAGAGSAAITPYAVSGLSYNLNANSPQNISSVTFSISPTTATTVKVRLAGTWYACTNSSGSVSCATTSPQANVNTANGTTLTVVATQ